ncbi:phosphoglycolate phosphatase [Kordiimonas lacus]|uniref:Phosphoglycolate phosphatase n=1 Tax=Kordiimonas lacus TaxID=637679 RepID=A0A1G6W354_9PROT|nr:phosphoglycolate phosphatase [Kordiimonas lacus]SDD60292.1 phosphoglycolate phosphatase [Kordiimonas lacus]
MSLFPAQKIVFDLDGTLIDSAPDLHAATNHVLEHIGRKTVTLDQVRHMVGYGALTLIKLGLEATGDGDEYTPEELRPVFLDYYGKNSTAHTRLFDGALDMLQHFRAAGVDLAICTNKPFLLTEPILANLGLRDLFSAVSGGDSFDFKKPDPRHILETASQMPGEGPIVMVGDSRPDIEAARAAGVPAIAVSFGYSQTPVHELAPDRVIDSLAELKTLITPA